MKWRLASHDITGFGSQSLATVFIIIFVFPSPRPLPCIFIQGRGRGDGNTKMIIKTVASDCGSDSVVVYTWDTPFGSVWKAWHFVVIHNNFYNARGFIRKNYWLIFIVYWATFWRSTQDNSSNYIKCIIRLWAETGYSSLITQKSHMISWSIFRTKLMKHGLMSCPDDLYNDI